MTSTHKITVATNWRGKRIIVNARTVRLLLDYLDRCHARRIALEIALTNIANGVPESCPKHEYARGFQAGLQVNVNIARAALEASANAPASQEDS